MTDNTMVQTAEIILPWYRQFWFWFVFGPLIFIIILCGFTVTTAFYYADDVVTDNYYKDGVMINQLFQQDERAEALGLTATITFDRKTREVLVLLKHAKPLQNELPKQLLLFMDNPVKKNKDQHVLLQEVSAGEYRAALQSPPEYSWYLALVPEADVSNRKKAEWLLSGEINLALTAETVLQPRIQ